MRRVMMNIILLLDAWGINLVEKMCHRFQRFTGITSCILYGFLAFFTCLIILDTRTNIFLSKELIEKSYFGLMYKLAPSLYWGLVLMGLLDSLLSFVREKELIVRISAGFKNPSKVNMLHVLLRITSAGIFAFAALYYLSTSSFHLFDLFIMLSFLVQGYIFACDPLPPSDSKIKEWIKNIKKFRLRMLVPIHAK
jgi:hypothetical protein